jgi:mRNA interferase MazF
VRQGDLLIINFPFSDRTAGKPRPALVISNDRHNARDVDRLFVLISSNTQVRSEEDLVIAPGDPDFASSGLKVASVFRCSKLVNLDSTKLRAKRIGRIGPAWVRKVADSISAVIHPSC